MAASRETPVAHFDVTNPFTAEEVEFQAEDELVTVVPKFRHDPFHFISGEFGPFVPNSAVQVPLWFAVTLRKRNRCSIAPPDWLELEALAEVLAAEQANDDEFQGLPYHFIEIAALLFECAADDIPEVDRVRTLLEDIQNVRMAKARKGIQNLAEKVNKDERITSVNLTNLAAMEVFQIRPFLTGALNHWYSLAIMPSTDESSSTTAAARRRVPQSRNRPTGGGSGGGSGSGGGPDDDGGGGTGGAAEQATPSSLPASDRKVRRLR